MSILDKIFEKSRFRQNYRIIATTVIMLKKSQSNINFQKISKNHEFIQTFRKIFSLVNIFDEFSILVNIF